MCVYIKGHQPSPVTPMVLHLSRNQIAILKEQELNAAVGAVWFRDYSYTYV